MQATTPTSLQNIDHAVVIGLGATGLSVARYLSAFDVPLSVVDISPDHMDRYASFGDYALAKSRVLKGCRMAVLPLHDSSVAQFTAPSNTRHFALQAPQSNSDYGVVNRKGRHWLMHGSRRLTKVKDIPLIGQHNVLDVLAAFALLEPFNLERKALVEAVRSAHGLPHRMEWVADIDGVVWVNDSKATNVGAAVTALSGFDQPIIWLAGGEGKDADFSELTQVLPGQVKHVIAFGRDADAILAQIPQTLPTTRVDSMQQAVVSAQRFAVSGDAVLLSPACASFDMYLNYEARGDDFKSAVRALSSEATQ